MADRKISDLTALTTPAAGDYLPIIDISEPLAANKNKRITIEELLRGAPDGTAGAPSFAFESDGGNGFYLAGTDTIGASTNGVNRLTLSTSALTSTVPISATSFIPTSSTVPTNGLYLPAANSVALSTNGTGRLFIDASGNVGIKASAPFQYGAPVADLAHLQLTSQQFSVVTFGGTGGATGQKYWRLISRASQAKFQLQSVDDSGNNEATAIEVVKGTAQAIDNVQLHTNGSERLRITSAGLVGIGASSVNDLLHLRNGSSFAIRLDDTSNTHFIAAITSPNSFGNGTTAGQLYLRGAAGIGFSGNGGTSIGMVVDSSNRVGIGTTSPSQALHTVGNGLFTGTVDIGNETSGRKTLTLNSVDNGAAVLFRADAATRARIEVPDGETALAFGVEVATTPTERMRIDSSGRLLVGTSSARTNFFNTTVAAQQQLEGTTLAGSISSIVRTDASAGPGYLALAKSRGASIGTNVIVQDADGLGGITFQGNDGTEFVEAARILAEVDGTPGANDMPGRLVFSTTADGASSPTERMRITSGGRFAFGGQGAPYSSATCDSYNNTSGEFAHAFRQDHVSGFGLGVGVDGTYLAYFYPNKDLSGAPVGSISQNGTATAYNTSSDYRLKENINAVTDGIARLQQLKPSRFNFIADPYKTVDGFIAHEVQAVVPEAINGEKDAVDDNGNPIYQGIDQSKLVPLLTAALQEAIGEIESLKARVAALESA